MLAFPPFGMARSQGNPGTPPPPIPPNPFVWWDNTDIDTLYSDVLGTTPAVKGDPIPFQRDKSGNGRHRTQPNLALAPILRQRADGVYYLDYSGGKWMSCPAPAGTWNFMHNGHGCAIAAALVWPGAAAGTYLQTASSTTQTGVLLNKTADQSGRFHVNQSVSGVSALTISIPAIHQSGALRTLFWSMAAGGMVTGMVDNARTKFHASPTAALPTGNHSTALQIGTSFNGAEYMLVIYDRPFEASEPPGIYAKFSHGIDFPVPDSFDYTLLAGGQSNMSGRGSLTTGLLSEAVQEGVYSYTRAGEYRIAAIPEHSIINQQTATVPNELDFDTPKHGLLLRAAKGIRASSGKTMLMVPCAVGGTSMTQWDTPGTVDDPTTLFGAMAARYGEVRARGGAPVLIWGGHEADAELAAPNYLTGGVGTAYLSAWTKLIADVRAHIVDAPLLYLQLSANHTEPRTTALAAAGEAARQYELLDARAHMIVTHDLERNAGADAIHISRNGFTTASDRAALAFRQHILGEAVDGTGPRLLGVAPVTWSGSTVILTLDKPVNASATHYGSMLRVYAGGVEQTVLSAVRGADPATVVITCAAALSGPVTLTYGYRTTAGGITRTDIILGVTGLPLPVFGPVLAVAGSAP